MMAMMRSLLRLAGRNRMLWKRLPADFGRGRICCSPEATLSVWKPGWASKQAIGLFDWVRCYVKPGMRIWDLGANQGLFSFAAAAKAGPQGEVIAFEPDPYLISLLERSIASGSHQGAPVNVLPLAVAEELAISLFLIAATDRTLNHLAEAKGNPRTGGSRASRRVMVVTLDWLSDQFVAPDLIKIDVEGAEDQVLRGGTELLRAHRPVVIVEVAAECAHSVAETFQAAGYLMLDVRTPERGPLASPAWNTLAVPAERLRDFA
jgi:FkbM family methyltransferase